MDTEKIIYIARTDFLKDSKHPFQFSDLSLSHFLLEAEREASRRALLLLDKTNATANDIATGTATSTTANKLVNSSASFTSTALNKTVYNTTDNTFATVSVVDSGTQLSLSADIMASGESYIIGDAAKALSRVCVVNGTSAYNLSEKILKVSSCYLSNDGLPLHQKTEGWLDRNYYQWRLAQGTPVYYIEEKGKITLVPKPDANLNSGTGKDILRLEVYRLPLTDQSIETNTTPEIPEEYHFDLIHWICHLAYSSPINIDADGARKSTWHLNMFENKFGRRLSAKSENAIRVLPGNFDMESVNFGIYP